MKLGNLDIKGIYVGNTPAAQVYVGNVKVWPEEQPAGDYWGLRLTAQEPDTTVSMKANGSAPSLDLLYSTDAIEWNTFTPGTTTVTLADVGDSVWFKAGDNGNNGTASSISNWWQFQISKKVAASGSIMSLINGNQQTYQLPVQNSTFKGLFKSTPITTAPNLPATNLTENCYNEMFNSCTYMSSCQDVLPAKVPASSAYEQMFSNSGLKKAPQIALSSVNARSLFQGMFDNCTSLTAAPSAVYGNKVEFATFNAMFKHNTSLTASPHLKQCNANASYAYYQMFSDSSSLKSISTDLTAWGSNTIWLKNVSASGTFYCPSILGTNSTIARGNDCCPNNWTVYNITTLKYQDGTAHMHAIVGSLTKQNVLDALEEDNQTSGNLRYVYMGQEVTAVASSAFADWTSLRGVVIGENVVEVNDNAFRSVQQLSSVVFAGNALESIGEFAFAGVQHTGQIDIPSGTLSIGEHAFQNSTDTGTEYALSVVTIPSTVTSIGLGAFADSDGIVSVIFNDKTMDEVTAMANYPWGASGKIFVNTDA